MKPLNSIAKRDLLAVKKFDPEVIKTYADAFMSQERYGDAFEFYRKAVHENGIIDVMNAAIRVADAELLWRIEHGDCGVVSPQDWTACGDNAMALGKFRDAAFAYKHSGDKENLAAAENKFTALSTNPPSS